MEAQTYSFSDTLYEQDYDLWFSNHNKVYLL